MTINLARSVALGLALASIAVPAAAQDVWPTGPLHVYVGFRWARHLTLSRGSYPSRWLNAWASP